MQTTLLIIAAVLLVAWLVLRSRGRVRKHEAPQMASRPQDTVFHAVSIRFDAEACDAAREMSGRRFLSTAAPRLPLPDCDAAQCTCRFVHHDDRRSGKDRRSPFAARGFGDGTGSFQKEKREQTDRRRDTDADLN